MRKTKIICTLGPATDDENVLRQLMVQGMDVARINMSHQDHSQQKIRIDKVKKVREDLSLPIALLLDTKGPEIRTGDFSSKNVTLKKGQKFTLTTRDIVGDNTISNISFKNLPNEISKGCRILIDDGLIELIAESYTDTDILCTVINGGIISSHKGINLPGTTLSIPFISEKDREDIKFAIENDFDFIAASFVRNARDILELKSELKKLNGENIKIISKIENSDGVNNIDNIIKVSDGIMVARGDLGVEIPLEEIPIIQKEIIKKSCNAGRLVITATQMLDSMMKNPRPTRAEATDVANAIYDGTSAIMLSGETASGNYPVEAVKTMSTIAKRTEDDIDYVGRLSKREFSEPINVTSAISHATCTTAHDLDAKAIITLTRSGRTAKMVSKYRPNCPIIAGTSDKKVLRQLNLSWGVIPLIMEHKDDTDKIFEHVISTSCKFGLVSNGDLVVITAGIPIGISGTTNLLKVHLVGDILTSGKGLSKQCVHGKLCVCKSEDDLDKNFNPGDILVINKTSKNIINYIKECSGIITEDDNVNSHAAIVGTALNKPIIIGAESATDILKTGELVTLDSSKGVVFSDTKKH